MIAAERLRAAKQYLRIDFDEDDTLIERLIMGADRYLHNAGIDRENDPAEYDMVIHNMVLNSYDNRGEGTETVSPMARQALNQLKFYAGIKAAGTYEEPDSGETPTPAGDSQRETDGTGERRDSNGLP